MVALRRRVLAAVLCGSAAWLTVLADAKLALGEDFRIENTVYADGQKTPSSRSTTIFHEGMVFDTMQDPDETVVFDKTGQRFILLDGNRRVRAELTIAEVAAFTQRLKQWGQEHKDPAVKFLAAPKLDEKYDETTNELTLTSPWMNYRLVLAEDSSDAIAQQYREFSDWLAQVNAMLNPGTRLPFPRLRVDEVLAKHATTAREVQLTMTLKKGSPAQRTTVRSQHELSKKLTEADLARVAQIRKSIDTFKSVSFADYRKVGARTASR